jgi:hypothetical protein
MNNGTMGDNSNEGENDVGCALEFGVAVYSETVGGEGFVGGDGLEKYVWGDVLAAEEMAGGDDAGFGAISRCFTDDVSEGSGLSTQTWEAEDCEDALEIGFAASMGSVSARSTTVWNESTNRSHAISVLSPAPDAITMRAMME